MALAVYAAVLIIYRPVSPFEWDEILFMRAMAKYDVAAHAPHPPGYPAFVALAKPVYWLTGDAQLGPQLAAIAGAVAAVGLLGLLAVRLGATRREVWCAAAVLAALPGFLFNANVGMSDVVGTAAAVAGVLALAVALDRPERLPLAAVVGGLALGVRPQVAYALIPVGVAAVVCAARARRWRPLLLAIAAGAAAGAASWVPAILITGPDRFLGAVRGQALRAVTAESAGRFSGAPPSVLADHWLLAPFGSSALAWVFWLLVLMGGVAHWRAGRRRLVAICLASGAAYLVLAAGTMHYNSSVRYVLPAMPFFAALAAGVAATERPVARRAAVAVAAAWSLYAALAVAGPSLDIRRRRPAPASEAMTWIAASYAPGETLIYYVGRIAPHIRMVLGSQGFTVKQAKAGVSYHAGLRPDGVVLLVSEKVIPGTQVLFAPEWNVPYLGRLSRERYARCVVAQAPPSPSEEALTATLRALATPELLAAAPRSSLLVVPAAAHGRGKLGAFWSTDLVVMLPEGGVATPVELRVVQRPDGPPAKQESRRKVQPGRLLLLRDVLKEPLAYRGFAAIEVRAGAPVAALWRTYDRRRPGDEESVGLLPAVPGEPATSAADFDLGAAWPARAAARCNVGFVNLGGAPADVVLEVTVGGATTSHRVVVPARASVQVNGVVAAVAARPLRATFRSTAPVVAYAAIVEQASGRTTYLTP
ncbi:MAG: hypothetical protein C3F15_15750 [Holophagae bacterium]|nr:MAG: hypothetical protein C3F15_15750 [Holophagae bacterium]